MVGLGHVNNFTAIRPWNDSSYAWTQRSVALSIRANASALGPLVILQSAAPDR